MSCAKEFAPAGRRVGVEAGTAIKTVFAGQWHVAKDENLMIETILGSCVAACARDPVAGVGGLNHFLLPGDGAISAKTGDAARYGAYAMESLLNGIFKAGGRKERLEIKLFGGANVTGHSSRIGSKNAEFVRKFLRDEGYKTACEDLEGSAARRLRYFPHSGKAMVRTLSGASVEAVRKEETQYSEKLSVRPQGGDVELF